MLSDSERAAARDTIRRGLDEDLCYGPDATTLATVPGDAVATASMVPREPGVVAGVDVAVLVLDEVLGAGGYEVVHRLEDGTPLQPGEALLTVRAPTRGLLIAERTMLNLICHLSGIATATAAWVAAVRAPGPRSATPAKPCPGCGCCRSMRYGSAGASTTGSGSATRP